MASSWRQARHCIVVLPKLDAAVVHRVDTDIPGNGEVSGRFGGVLRRILAAAGWEGVLF